MATIILSCTLAGASFRSIIEALPKHTGRELRETLWESVDIDFKIGAASFGSNESPSASREFIRRFKRTESSNVNCCRPHTGSSVTWHSQHPEKEREISRRVEAAPVTRHSPGQTISRSIETKRAQRKLAEIIEGGDFSNTPGTTPGNIAFHHYATLTIDQRFLHAAGKRGFLGFGEKESSKSDAKGSPPKYHEIIVVRHPVKRDTPRDHAVISQGKTHWHTFRAQDPQQRTIRVWIPPRSELDRRGWNVSPRKDLGKGRGSSRPPSLPPPSLYRHKCNCLRRWNNFARYSRPAAEAARFQHSLLYWFTERSIIVSRVGSSFVTLPGHTCTHTHAHTRTRTHLMRCDVTTNDQGSIHGSKSVLRWLRNYTWRMHSNFTRNSISSRASRLFRDSKTTIVRHARQRHSSRASEPSKTPKMKRAETVLCSSRNRTDLSLRRKQGKHGSSRNSTWRDTIEGSRSEFVSSFGSTS